MQRKVIKQGNNTLTVTLPRKWVERWGIKAGDELNVSEQEHALTVSTSHAVKLPRKALDISELDMLIPRAIHALYKKGYDSLCLNFSEPKMLGLVHKALGNETIGFEIAKQGSKYCEINNISEVLTQEFDSTLRRIFLTLNMLAQDGLAAVRKNEIAGLQYILKLEETNNRLTTFCRRALNKYGYKDQQQLVFLYLIIEELEKIADEYKYLYQYVMKNKGVKLSKDVLTLFEQVNSLVEDYYTLFYDFQPAKAVAIAKKRKQLVTEAYDFFSGKSIEETRVAHYLIIVIQRVFNIIGPLLAMKL